MVKKDGRTYSTDGVEVCYFNVLGVTLGCHESVLSITPHKNFFPVFIIFILVADKIKIFGTCDKKLQSLLDGN